MATNTRDTPPIVIVGAGVVGASAAHHLARAGHPVIVLEQDQAASGVTRSSFAWVGVSGSDSDTYSRSLRAQAVREFTRLTRELPGNLGLRPRGALMWEASEAATREFVRAHQALGHPVELIGQDEVRAREPRLHTPPAVAALAPGDTGVDPVAFTRALLRSAIAHGATVHSGTRVTSLITSGDRVVGVQTPDGPLLASNVILASGTATPGLAAAVGHTAQVESSPSCLIRCTTREPLLGGILSTPDFEVRQLDDVTLIAAEDVPLGYSGTPRELAEHTLAAIRLQLDGGESVEYIDAVIADRPVPAEGQLLMGFAAETPGLYVAAAHPGIILSGSLGTRIARDFAAEAAPPSSALGRRPLRHPTSTFLL